MNSTIFDFRLVRDFQEIQKMNLKLVAGLSTLKNKKNSSFLSNWQLNSDLENGTFKNF